ncbi:integrase family protein [Oleidesulfovibrio alaskensis G20]|jgi:integrase|uniref:Integrase family protein n=1 Tax=Oleidesulfovibrio alaskensis (strain ATCC BAA-1058 / DSM 17464 / G20) TaxID=207559 RepID=Q30XD6_OLEA2|nr:site-specific integrase [Oleidesulfovibrio alaskensis]ABB39660.1 integrase family protein [Oleidesulfovibrio alaskensis G20]
MAFKWIKTNIKGIRYREHDTRKHGIKKDRYYTIRYQRSGQRVEEGLGWASEGWTLDKAVATLAKLREAATTGEGETRLQEKRKAAEAQKALKEKKNITFATILAGYLEAGTEKKNTRVLAVQKGYGDKWLLPDLGPLPIRQVTAGHLEQIQKQILAAGRSKQTAAHAIDLFRAAWNWAYKRELIEGRNPVTQMERIRPDGSRERFFSAAELQSLLGWLHRKDIHTYRITLCAAHTGARLGELAHLTWDRVNLPDRQINFIHTKSGVPRSVPMTPELHDMFSDLLMTMSSAKTSGIPLGTNYTPAGLAGKIVFLTKARKPFFKEIEGRLRTDTPTAFRSALSALKLNEGHATAKTKLTFHCLRHTAATLLLSNGVDPVTVQNIMGWSTLKMLERYSHAIPATKRKAMEALSAALSGEG